MNDAITVSQGVKDSEYGKILFSGVMVTKKRNLFLGRAWTIHEFKTGAMFIFVHSLALFAPFTFTWGAFWASLASDVLCRLFGISVSYHRNLAHQSVKFPKWLEYTFAYIGVLAFQRDPIFWVSIHRYHHQYVDSEKDPHSPIFGFWFSHMGWLFDHAYIREKYQERKHVEDLKKQALYRFLKRTYILHLFAYSTVLYVFGGFTYLVWVVGVSVTLGYHATFLVNSACHIWGNQAWNTGDLSKNNCIYSCYLLIMMNAYMWIALTTFGEGWHNNHHAFEYSARHGIEWWQIDLGWFTIRFLEAVGLATNVKLPTEGHKLKKSVVSFNKFK